MKSFTEYLMESQQKTYHFKAKFAKRLDDEALGLIESALKAVDLASLGKPKYLPMQSHIEFPNLGPIEATLLDIEVCFPVNDAQIKSLITERAFMPASGIIVCSGSGFEVEMRETDEERKNNKESLLTKDLEETSGGQEAAGQKRADSMLKDLHSRKYEFAKTEGGKTKTTNELPQNNTSVMGNHKPNLPKVGK